VFYMKEISVEALKAKLDNREDFIFIDVREPYEFEEFNLGARLIPLGEIMDNLHLLDGHKNDEIIVHCRSGKRSGMAVDILNQAGFTNVTNVIGGVLRWQEVFPA
jgi:rhodanese-related sulfurtransferase